jgi:hypothetical protein
MANRDDIICLYKGETIMFEKIFNFLMTEKKDNTRCLTISRKENIVKEESAVKEIVKESNKPTALSKFFKNAISLLPNEREVFYQKNLISRSLR